MNTRNIFHSLLILLFSETISAQNYIVKVQLKKSKRYYYYNLEGEQVIAQDYFNCSDFSPCGRAVALKSNNDRYTIIDTKGNEIETDEKLRPLICGWDDSIYPFKGGMILTRHRDRFGAFNADGKLTVPVVYKELTEFDANYSTGKKKLKYYVIHKNGNTIPVQARNIRELRKFTEGLASIKIGEHFGYIDTLGNLAIPAKFYSVGYFKNGLAWAKTKDRKVGYINRKGEWAIKPIYFDGRDYDAKSGLAKVTKESGWGYVNLKGEFSTYFIPNKYFCFSEGRAIIRYGEKVGYIDNTGKQIIDPIYRTVADFKNGFARAELTNDKWGIIDNQGNWVLKPTFKTICDVIAIDNLQ